MESWGFTFCLSLPQRITYLLLAVAPAGWAASARLQALLQGWQNGLRLAGQPWGSSPQGRRRLQWPKGCGTRVGCDSQRASPSALCAKAWTWDPSVQSFGWWWNSEEKKYEQELQKGAWSNGNVHHLNNAFDNFYPGSSSQFKGNNISFRALLFPAAIHDLSIAVWFLVLQFFYAASPQI